MYNICCKCGDFGDRSQEQNITKFLRMETIVPTYVANDGNISPNDSKVVAIVNSSHICGKLTKMWQIGNLEEIRHNRNFIHFSKDVANVVD